MLPYYHRFRGEFKWLRIDSSHTVNNGTNCSWPGETKYLRQWFVSKCPYKPPVCLHCEAELEQIRSNTECWVACRTFSRFLKYWPWKSERITKTRTFIMKDIWAWVSKTKLLQEKLQLVNWKFKKPDSSRPLVSNFYSRSISKNTVNTDLLIW